MIRSSFKEKLFWVLGKRERYRVAGSSMYPTLRAGSDVLVDRFCGSLLEGDVVVCYHPLYRDLKLIKRVKKVYKNGSVHVFGDAYESYGSNFFGLVSRERIIGKVASLFSTP